MPVALSAEPESGCTGAASAQFSPPNDSAVGIVPITNHRRRLSRTISCEMGELDWTLLSFVSECRLASGKQLVVGSGSRTGGRSAEARAADEALARLAGWRVLDPLHPRRRRASMVAATRHLRVGVAGVKLLAQRGFIRSGSVRPASATSTTRSP